MGLVIGPRFTLKNFEPHDIRTMPKADRQAFWNAVSQFVTEAKMQELAAGLDRFGADMIALSSRTIKDRHSDMGPADPHGPQLQPAHGLSRTRSLFVAQPTVALDGVTCYWGYDEHTGGSWGDILKHHRAGNKHLPKRDVIGLSPQSLATVRSKATAWWNAYLRGVAKGAPFTLTAPEAPTPKFTYQRVPPYVPKAPEAALPKQKARVSELSINGKHYTFQSGSAAQVKESIAVKGFSGWHTPEQLEAERIRLGTERTATGGFRFRFGPGTPTAPAPMPRPPRPPKPPKPAPVMKKAAAEEELGLKFSPAPVAVKNPGYTTVVVDVAKVDADLAMDPGYHVGKGGIGAGIAGRYEQFKRFLARAKEEDVPIEQPRATIATDTGRVALGDGRHRFAVLRDLGARIIPISVRRSVAAAMRRLYGAAAKSGD